jgi:hypothetical protein
MRETMECGEWRKLDDEESGSEVQWQSRDFLIEKMRAQRDRYGLEDPDESEILRRLI